MKKHFLAALSLSLFAAFAVTPAAYAAETKKTPAKEAPKEMSKEERQKMAEMHSKIAACLNSDAPMKDCMAEMKQMKHECGHGAGMACNHGNGMECPMMGKKGHAHQTEEDTGK